jgi:putative sigma-54 modulation protein
MKVIISGRHVEVTDALRSFIEKKVIKIEEFFSGVRQVKVILEVQKYRHTAEIVFKAANKTITARKTTKDMYTSLEEVLHAVERQATKRKEKLTSGRVRRNQGKAVKKLMPENPVEAVEVKKNAVRKKAPAVVALAVHADKPMTVEEAALQMQAGNQEIIAFVNTKTRKTNVLIRRKKDFGLIEPAR